MKRVRLVLLTAAMIFPLVAGAATAEVAKWKAISMNGEYYGVGKGGREDEARANAIFDCNKKAGSGCSRGTAMEVDQFLAGVVCGDNSQDFTAGSWKSADDAVLNAKAKGAAAGYDSCKTIVNQ